MLSKYRQCIVPLKGICFVWFLVISGSLQSYSQNCSAVLSVEKNRSTRSADEDGAEYWLILKNTSSIEDVFELSFKYQDESCSNSNKPSSQPNLKLNVLFDINIKTNQKHAITLGAGESRKFNVLVTASKGSPYNRWSCIEIIASPTKCRLSAIKTLLSVFVPDPSEG